MVKKDGSGMSSETNFGCHAGTLQQGLNSSKKKLVRIT
jgi:hypothetical protein